MIETDFFSIVLGHGMMSILGVNENLNSIYGLTVKEKTMSLNLNTLRISYLSSNAFENIKKSEHFKMAKGFTREELYEKGITIEIDRVLLKGE